MPSKRRARAPIKARRAAPKSREQFKAKYGFTPPKASHGQIKISSAQLAKMLRVEKALAVSRRAFRVAKAKAYHARDIFRPRKDDRGKIIMVGTTGKRAPQAKGRKGYAVYVTSTGKKLLVKAPVKKPYAARKISELELPVRKNFKRPVEAFQAVRRRVLALGKVTQPRAVEARVHKQVLKTGLKGESAFILEDFRLSGKGKGAGKVKTGGAWDFNTAAVQKMARHIKGVMEAQRGQRNFQITAMALIKLPDGRKDVIRFTVDIARRDRLAIRLGGVENFIRQKAYAFMARELSYQGLITSGSANHIRRVMGVTSITPQVWNDYQHQKGRSMTWGAKSMEVAQIESLEWKLDQL